MGWNFILGWKENFLVVIMFEMWCGCLKYEIKD